MARKTTKKKAGKGKEAAAKRDSSLTFEEAVERLETLVAKLEEGEVPLEESLQAYVEGTRLVRNCLERLDRAEATILKLSEEGGAFHLEEGLEVESRTEEEEEEDGPDDEEGQDELPF